MDEQVFGYAVSELMKRVKPAGIVTELVRHGLSMTDAKKVVQAAVELKKDHFKKQGAKRMAWGALAAIVGLALTFATYSAASGGGRYVVFSGLIAVGGVYALVGFVQHLTGWKIS